MNNKISDFDLNVLLVVRSMEAIDTQLLHTHHQRVVQTLFIQLGKTVNEVALALTADRSHQKHMNPTLAELCIMTEAFLKRWHDLCKEKEWHDVEIQRVLVRSELFTLTNMLRDDPDDLRYADLCHRQLRLLEEAVKEIDRTEFKIDPDMRARELYTSNCFMMQQATYTYKILLNLIKNKDHVKSHVDTMMRLLNIISKYRERFEEAKVTSLEERFLSVEGTMMNIKYVYDKEFKKCQA